MRWTLLINLSPPPPLENHVGITILFLINGLNAITKQKTISPEAAAGGGLAIIKTNDMVRIDLNEGSANSQESLGN